MTVDPAVIRDLLPLYLAGEASPASCKLVEEHLAANPDLARLAAAAADADLSRIATASVLPPPSAEKSALEATRRLLRWRSWLMGGAIFATLLPFSVYGSDRGIEFFVLRDAPATAAISLFAAAVLWLAFWRVSRKLRVTGL